MFRPAMVALSGALIAASPGLAAGPFWNLRGKARVLVVSAPSAADPALAKQNQWLEAGAEGLRERAVVVVRIVGGLVDAPKGLKLDAQGARKAMGLTAAHFGAALIGKDGSEVFQQSTPIEMRALFETIDAMPMRREEMKQRKP